MFLKQTLILLGITLIAGNAAAQSTTGSAYGPDTGAGHTSEADNSVRVQYRRYHFFVKDDSFALDLRVQNFYNGKRFMSSYFYSGGYTEPGRDDDLLGTPVPIGVVIGLNKKLQAYIQAEPNFDLNNDKDIKAGGAVGIRFQF